MLVSILCAVIVLLVLAGMLSLFFMCWPWWWEDTHKIRRYLVECGDGHVEIKGQWWARWQRVATFTWIPVRKYNVFYIDLEGQRHKASAEFYLPYWLNKMHDPGVIDSFDWTEEELPPKPPAGT